MNIKLLICYHKPAHLLKDNILTPIHVGRALAKEKMDHESPNYKWLINNMIGDDTGNNISKKNGSYNEMTCLYWAWKNYDKLGNPDYIGLMHYRRHFILHEGEIDVVHFDKLDAEHYFDEINYSEKKLKKLVEGCDFVAHIGKVNNVYNHYLENHRKEDIDLAFEILYEKYPEYKKYAEEYFSGDYSNFCNMFIFSREIFFDYCEWIFGILEEFEKRVDISEKRFFISERLSGVYIYRLMQKKELRHKVIPIAFIADPVTVSIAMPVNEENQFALAVSITSLLVNKHRDSQYTIYLLGNSKVSDAVKNKFGFFEKEYNNCKIQFISTKVPPEYYPLILSELLPTTNKCIYMEENSIILKDLSEFFRTCSVDDFYVVGAPLKDYDVLNQNKEVNPSFVVMNCASLRRHKIYEQAQMKIDSGSDAIELFHTLLKGQLGYVPWYFMTVTGLTAPSGLFDRKKTRGSYQADAVWKPVMFYSENMPWSDPQGVFSNFWWNIAAKVPSCFEFIPYSSNVLRIRFGREQKEINRIVQGKPNEQNLVAPKKEEQIYSAADGNRAEQEAYWQEVAETMTVPTAATVQNTEERKQYSFLNKLKFYYNHNGFKQTVRYGLQKLTGGSKK